MADQAMVLQEGFSHKFRRSGCNFYIPHKVHTSTCLSSMVCLLRDQIGRFPLGGWLVGGGGGGGEGVTTGYFPRTCYCFYHCFLENFVGDKDVMEGNKVVKGGSLQSHHLGKTLNSM